MNILSDCPVRRGIFLRLSHYVCNGLACARIGTLVDHGINERGMSESEKIMVGKKIMATKSSISRVWVAIVNPFYIPRGMTSIGSLKTMGSLRAMESLTSMCSTNVNAFINRDALGTGLIDDVLQ